MRIRADSGNLKASAEQMLEIHDDISATRESCERLNHVQVARIVFAYPNCHKPILPRLCAATIIMKPIDAMFGRPLAMAMDIRKTIGDAIRFLTRIDAAIDEELQLTGEVCGADFPQYNAGVISYCRSAATRELFGRWHEEWL